MSGLGRRASVPRRPLLQRRVASKGVEPLLRRRGGALAHGCGRSGRGALPLPRAAVISTRLRVHAALGVGLERHAAQQGRRLALAPPRLAACRRAEGLGFGTPSYPKLQMCASRACETSLVLPPCPSHCCRTHTYLGCERRRCPRVPLEDAREDLVRVRVRLRVRVRARVRVRVRV